MEFDFEIDLISEVLIPLENGNDNKKEDKFSELSDVLQKTYKDFRSVIFQGELLRFFVIISMESLSKNKDLAENLDIKFEFDHSCEVIKENDNNINNLDNISLQGDYEPSFMSVDEEKPSIHEHYSLHKNSIFNKDKKYKENSNCDFISRRQIIEEKNLLILEVIRNVSIPNKLLNKSIIMKVHIMKKNYISHLSDGSYSLIDLYTSGIYHQSKEFTVLKTVFKEVTLVGPLIFSKVNQIDILPDISLLTIKLENTTKSVNFVDKHLRVSRFLKKSTDDEISIFGMSLFIKDIHILREETIIDRHSKFFSKKLESALNHESFESALSKFDFQLLNSDILIELKPGEEYVIAIKIFKSSVTFNNYYKLSLPNSRSSLNQPPQENLIHPGVTHSVIFNQNSSQFVKHNTLANASIIGESFFKQNSSVTPPTKFSLSQFSQLDSSPHKSFNLVPNSSALFGAISENRSVINFNPHHSFKNSETVNFSDFEEIIKLNLETPLVINLDSVKLYDNLFVTVPLKWQNEIYRSIKLEVNVQEKIKIHEHFIISLKIRNFSMNPMLLELEINEIPLKNENEKSKIFCNAVVNNKPNNSVSQDEIPGLISEIRSKVIGEVHQNEEKIVDVKMISFKNGFINMPTFTLKEKNSQKRFFFSCANKIYVE